jgi:hypothetical protein
MKSLTRVWAFLISSALFLILFSFNAAAGSPSANYFEFHNNFWMNLHHTLFREMVVGKMDDQTKKRIGLVPLSDAGLSEQEKQVWTSAIHFYSTTFAGRRLLFDAQLVTLNNSLGRQKDPQKLDPSGLAEDFVRCLENASPIYRRHWWPEHQRANEQFIAEMQPKVDEFGPLVIPRLDHFFGMQWQSSLQVDVTYYVAEIGSAYTTEDPGHTTVASGRDDNHGLPGMETLFHEGAHTLTDKMASVLWDECRRQKKDCKDLWHAVQFYTVGAMVKEALAAHGAPGYIPYAYRFGLYERGDWPKFRPAIERDWQPYLDGKSSLDEAVSNLVRDVA